MRIFHSLMETASRELIFPIRWDVWCKLNTLRPRRNEQHFADDIFKRIFFNENVWISIKISLKFVPKGPINNIPALVQIMAWRRSGDKTLSGPMLGNLSTHICLTRPQWVNVFIPEHNASCFEDDIFNCVLLKEGFHIFSVINCLTV